VATAVSLRLSFPLISLEGESFWFLLTAPVSRLKLFIEKIGLEEWLSAESEWNCISEYYCHETRESRPDFLIKSRRFCILIEMKIDAEDGNRQLARYAELLETSEFQDIEAYKIYYLTLSGKKPTHQSAEDIDVELISFKKHVIDWLNSCIEITDNNKSVYSGIQQYRGLIEKLALEESGLVEMVDVLKSDCNYATFHNILEVLCKFEDAENELKKQTLLRFYEQLDKYLSPTGFKMFDGWSVDYIDSKCKYVAPSDYHFQKSRGICFYLSTDYTYRQKKSKKKYTIELVVDLENDFYNSTLWYGLMLWNITDESYLTDVVELEMAFNQLGFIEGDLFQDWRCWNFFSSKDELHRYCFSELTDPVIDMFTDEGLNRQVRHIIGEIQRVIDLFDEDRKYKIDSAI
jgi:hypothetical protein